MAKILLSYYRIQEITLGKTLCFWDSLAQELVKAGNDVMLVNVASCNIYHSNKPINKNIANRIFEKVKEFNPDLIITFNHRIIDSILKKFDVPIIIWDGDKISYFCDLDYIKKNISRYKIFSSVKDWKKDYIDFGFDDDKIMYVPPATSVKPLDIEQEYNISWLGQLFKYNSKYYDLVRNNEYPQGFYSIVKEFLTNPDYNYKEIFHKYFNDSDLNFTDKDLYPFFDYRLLTLGNLLDLGLTICGANANWDKIVKSMPQILTAYKPDVVWDLEDNINFYNKSKISLSIHHPQAQGAGFSWRCFDVMASNACLACTTSTELKELTKGIVEIPMFDTPYEARELCIKLLKDDSLRKEIVSKSQNYINANARWEQRFKQMQEYIDVPIINQIPGKLYNITEYSEKPIKGNKYKYYLEYKIWKHLNKKLTRKGII